MKKHEYKTKVLKQGMAEHIMMMKNNRSKSHKYRAILNLPQNYCAYLWPELIY